MRFRDVALAAIGYVIEYRKPLARALLAPFLLFMLLDAATLLEPDLPMSIFLGIIGIMVQTIFAITTHRIILMGPDAIPEWGQFRWSRRETVFALRVIGLSLMLIPAALPALIPGVGWIIAIGLACWITGRLSLVFPALAIDQDTSFGTSWDLTENRQYLMFLVVIVYPLLTLLPTAILVLIPYSFVAISFVTTFATVFTVATLSVAYRAIYEETCTGIESQ